MLLPSALSSSHAHALDVAEPYGVRATHKLHFLGGWALGSHLWFSAVTCHTACSGQHTFSTIMLPQKVISTFHSIPAILEDNFLWQCSQDYRAESSRFTAQLEVVQQKIFSGCNIGINNSTKLIC